VFHIVQMKQSRLLIQGSGTETSRVPFFLEFPAMSGLLSHIARFRDSNGGEQLRWQDPEDGK
jgi:hypothetical protein